MKKYQVFCDNNFERILKIVSTEFSGLGRKVGAFIPNLAFKIIVSDSELHIILKRRNLEMKSIRVFFNYW